MVNLNSNKPILQSLYLILPPPPVGSHLGRGIWQRLPRFPPSPVNLCLHLHYSADPPEKKTFSLCGGERIKYRSGRATGLLIKEGHPAQSSFATFITQVG